MLNKRQHLPSALRVQPSGNGTSLWLQPFHWSDDGRVLRLLYSGIYSGDPCHASLFWATSGEARSQCREAERNSFNPCLHGL